MTDTLSEIAAERRIKKEKGDWIPLGKGGSGYKASANSGTSVEYVVSRPKTGGAGSANLPIPRGKLFSQNLEDQ